MLSIQLVLNNNSVLNLPMLLFDVYVGFDNESKLGFDLGLRLDVDDGCLVCTPIWVLI